MQKLKRSAPRSLYIQLSRHDSSPKICKQVTAVYGHKTLRHVIQKLTRASHSQQLTAFAKQTNSDFTGHRPKLSKLSKTKQPKPMTFERFQIAKSKNQNNSQYSHFRLLKCSTSHFQVRLRSTDFLFSSDLSRKSQKHFTGSNLIRPAPYQVVEN